MVEQQYGGTAISAINVLGITYPTRESVRISPGARFPIRHEFHCDGVTPPTVIKIAPSAPDINPH